MGSKGVLRDETLSFVQHDGRPGPWVPVADVMKSEGWDNNSDDLLRMLCDFCDGCRGSSGGLLGGVHEAMDLTLPGLVSEESANADGDWMRVPDTREWTSPTERLRL